MFIYNSLYAPINSCMIKHCIFVLICRNKKYIQRTSKKNNPAQVAKLSHMKYEINPALSAQLCPIAFLQ